jgi:hypothetical protein
MAEKHRPPHSASRAAAAASVRRATKASTRLLKVNSLTRPIVRKGLRARGVAILKEAAAAGYLDGQKTERIGGRVTRKLLTAAKAKSGLTSQTELLEYALSQVAMEDDYAATLLSMKGSIPDDVEL